MALDNSFDDTIFSFVENSMNMSCAGKLVEDKLAIFDCNSQINDKYNSFPLFGILYEHFILMFFFKVYISKQYNKMYLEFKGVSQKSVSTYVPLLNNGIATISLDNVKEDIENYLQDEFILHAKYIFKDTSYEFDESRVITLPNSKEILPFLDMGKWQLIDKKKIAMRPLASFIHYEIEIKKVKSTIPIIRASEYKIIEFEIYKNSSKEYVYIISNGFIWGVPIDRYNYFLTYLLKEQEVYKELEV